MKFQKKLQKLQPTENDERHADEAEYSSARQSEHAGPPATHQFPVHQEYAEDVGRDLNGAHNERVDVNVAVQLAGVERQRVVQQTAREPVSTQPCIPPRPLDRVPASVGARAGMSLTSAG